MWLPRRLKNCGSWSGHSCVTEKCSDDDWHGPSLLYMVTLTSHTKLSQHHSVARFWWTLSKFDCKAFICQQVHFILSYRYKACHVAPVAQVVPFVARMLKLPTEAFSVYPSPKTCFYIRTWTPCPQFAGTCSKR